MGIESCMSLIYRSDRTASCCCTIKRLASASCCSCCLLLTSGSDSLGSDHVALVLLIGTAAGVGQNSVGHDNRAARQRRDDDSTVRMEPLESGDELLHGRHAAHQLVVVGIDRELEYLGCTGGWVRRPRRRLLDDDAEARLRHFSAVAVVENGSDKEVVRAHVISAGKDDDVVISRPEADPVVVR